MRSSGKKHVPARSQPSRTQRAVHPALSLALVALLVCLALWGIQRYRHRFVRTDVDLVRLLPSGDVTSFYADLELLRRSGYLQLLAAQSVDPEYRRFVQETNFDFARDLDAMAGVASRDGLNLFLKGR